MTTRGSKRGCQAVTWLTYFSIPHAKQLPAPCSARKTQKTNVTRKRRNNTLCAPQPSPERSSRGSTRSSTHLFEDRTHICGDQQYIHHPNVLRESAECGISLKKLRPQLKLELKSKHVGSRTSSSSARATACIGRARNGRDGVIRTQRVHICKLSGNDRGECGVVLG